MRLSFERFLTEYKCCVQTRSYKHSMIRFFLNFLPIQIYNLIQGCQIHPTLWADVWLWVSPQAASGPWTSVPLCPTPGSSTESPFHPTPQHMWYIPWALCMGPAWWCVGQVRPRGSTRAQIMELREPFLAHRLHLGCSRSNISS